MNSGTFAKKLLGELPRLVSEGVLNEEYSLRLKKHYEAKALNGANLTVLIFAVLGALLVGGGVILLVAHNWEELGRHARAGLSLLPLLICQLLAIWVVLTGRREGAWGEGVGVGWHLATGAAIALISQTYHIGGTATEYLFGWALLTLPLTYLLGSTASFALWVFTWSAWAISSIDYQWERVWLFWPVALLFLPYILKVYRKNRYGGRAGLVSIGIAALVGAGCLSAHLFVKAPMLSWLAPLAASILYLMGLSYFSKAETLRQNTLLSLGALALAIVILVYSYGDIWRFVMRDNFNNYKNLQGMWHYYGYANFALFALGWALLLAVAVRKRGLFSLAFGLFPAVMLFSWVINTILGVYMPGMVIVNLYGLLVGVLMVIRAAKATSVGGMNRAMIFLSALIALRFFDSDLSILTKGLAFIIIGALFFAANFKMTRKAKVTT
ncbi:MAG: hypothetical protein C0608_04125 [Deltaproteobacteria bacterium]|nr:MAG: hypothetical protein C0608_04125 [Deltaproteobacteria bacterium]